MTNFSPATNQTNNISTFTASVGDTIQLTRPVGYPAYPSDHRPAGYSPGKTEAWGFAIIDTNLGEFVRFDEVNWDSGYVYYKHNKSGKQIIEFTSYGIKTMKFYIVIQAINVHDHATIYQGGPAFATYYADVANPEET